MVELVKTSYYDFMELYIDYWQLINIPPDLRIKRKEKAFMVHTMVLNMQGLQPNNPDYIRRMKKIMNLGSNAQVYNYRLRLKNKGFIIENGSDLSLPSALNILDVPKKAVFNFTVIMDVDKNITPLPVAKPKPVKKKQIVKKEVKQPVKPPVEQPSEQFVEEDDVVLPAAKPEPVRDPMPEVAQTAYKYAKQMKRKGGYSDESYIEQNVKWDQRNIPQVEEEEDEESFNIINLED